MPMARVTSVKNTLLTLFLSALSALSAGCSSEHEKDDQLLSAELPLHLEEHLDAANLDGSEAPAKLRDPIEWHFDEPQPEWRPVQRRPNIAPAHLTGVEDALRVTLTEGNRSPASDRLEGAIYVSLPEALDHREWDRVLVRARTSDASLTMGLHFNLGRPELGERVFQARGQDVFLIQDGSVQTYELRADYLVPPSRGWSETWTEIGFTFSAKEPASIDLLSVRVIPREASYAGSPVGVRTHIKSENHRRVLFMHTPGRLAYRVRVPEAGRLDLGLGVLGEQDLVTFRVLAEREGETPETLFEEMYGERERWGQRSVNLAHLADRTIRLVLEVESARLGTTALWAAPTLSGRRDTERPNVIFYVIDGGGADHMSVYNYNRRTTPNLERLAAEGVVFENAYSNSTWTQPSTSSFMTSLHTSALGGYRGWARPMIPEEPITMAHFLHRAGYQTAVLTTNPNAGSEAGLERDGVDLMRDTDSGTNYTSSKDLAGYYWTWREDYPGEPYWVHFQTDDVHWSWSWPGAPESPFSGVFVDPDLRAQYSEWQRLLEEAGGRGMAAVPSPEDLERLGIDADLHLHAQRGLYDEAMAQQDYQLGQLVKRLKARDEWHRTLLIVASDHGGVAGLGDPSTTAYDPMFRSAETRIPLMIFWPDRIVGGQRFSQPVSMVDVLPTILDLVGLPLPEPSHGQSLAPLLLGRKAWDARPVILDEFGFDEGDGVLSGVIEVIDGRWGASLQINPRPGSPAELPDAQRSVPLLLYDLWNDPQTQHSLHEERQDLVEHYTNYLEARWRAHQRVAEQFTRSEASTLRSETLRTLRSLGYID